LTASVLPVESQRSINGLRLHLEVEHGYEQVNDIVIGPVVLPLRQFQAFGVQLLHFFLAKAHAPFSLQRLTFYLPMAYLSIVVRLPLGRTTGFSMGDDFQQRETMARKVLEVQIGKACVKKRLK
jgi:hypothetical protein